MKNITIINRVLRLVLSLGLVVTVLVMSGPVGGMVYALFVSIYTGLTAFIGWDPAIALMDYFYEKALENTSTVNHDKLVHH